MGYQGARRSRPAAHARQEPWPPADDPDEPGQPTAPGPPPQAARPAGTGGYRILESGTGPQRTFGPGGGPQPAFGPGSGPQPAVGPGSGAQPALDRTPVRGFPPLAPGQQQPQTPPDGFSAWHTPGPPPLATSPTGPLQGATYPDGGRGIADGPAGGSGDDADGYDGGPVAPASIAPGPRRRGRRPGAGPGPDAGAGPRAGRAGSAGARRRSSRMAWLAVAGVVIVAGGGYAGYKYLYEARVNAPVPSSLRLPTNAPGSPGFDQALGKWQHIGTRAQDPEPLTLQQLFPPQFEFNGGSYLRTAAALSKDCTQAVFGANLQAALQNGRCTQVLRASYISGTMMGTVGVANLDSANAAQKAGATTGPQEIIAPLAAQHGPTAKLGNGTGVVQAEIKGHYLILMWAEFTNLKSPSTSAQRAQLEQFAANMVNGSANFNLSTRMLTGKSK
jgi:hypothetical protein